MKKEKTIKALLAEIFALTKKESFLDAKLQDGTIIRTDDDMFKTGSKVSLLSEDGTISPVVDGDYHLEDGSLLTIKSGVVEVIVPPAADANAPAVDDTTAANPTVDAPAGMSTEPTPVPAMDATTAPAETPAEESTETSDMATLVEIVKNLTERVSALEEKLSSTKMAVEKMSALPAAKPFNANGEKRTVGDYLEAYRAEHKSKVAFNKERLVSNEFKANRGVEKPLVFSKANKPAAFNTAPENRIDLGLGNGFSITN